MGQPMSWSRLLRLLALLVTAFAAASFTPASAGSPDVSPDRQILVMVSHPPDHYRAGGGYGGGYGDEIARSGRERLARSIAARYGLTFVDNWPMPMIGVDCFVMAVPRGRATTPWSQQVSHDRASIGPSRSNFITAHRRRAQRPSVRRAAGRGAMAPRRPAPDRQRPGDADRGRRQRHRRRHPTSPASAGQPQLRGRPTVVAEQHGTAVAGIIAAMADNRLGIVGVAPGARLLGLRACWQLGPAAPTACDTLSLAKALYLPPRAARRHQHEPERTRCQLLRALLELRLAAGPWSSAQSTRGCRRRVSRLDARGHCRVRRALAGSRGNVYVAPGRGVPTTEPGGRWFIVNGSSFAAAHVSGLVALMRERRHRRRLP